MPPLNDKAVARCGKCDRPIGNSAVGENPLCPRCARASQGEKVDDTDATNDPETQVDEGTDKGDAANGGVGVKEDTCPLGAPTQ